MQYSASGRQDLSQYQLIHHYQATEATTGENARKSHYSQTAQNILVRISGLLLETADEQPLKHIYRLLMAVADETTKDQAADIKQAVLIASQIDLMDGRHTSYERKAIQILKTDLRSCMPGQKTQDNKVEHKHQAQLRHIELVA